MGLIKYIFDFFLFTQRNINYLCTLSLLILALNLYLIYYHILYLPLSKTVGVDKIKLILSGEYLLAHLHGKWLRGYNKMNLE